MVDSFPLKVQLYVAPNGTVPVLSWLESLCDIKARAHIKVRITRLELGDFGDCRSLGGGVSELKIHCGPGYRLYFVCTGPSVVLLLCGGSKNRQESDIAKARRYWRDYQKRQQDDATL
jgi:putative addiction module killer protein